MNCWLGVVAASMCFHNHLKIGLLPHGTRGCLKKKKNKNKNKNKKKQQQKKNVHMWNFHSSAPTMEQTFDKPFNAGQKPGYHQNIIFSNVQSVVVDHYSPV